MQWFSPLSGCYCGLFLSASTAHAIDWDKIATAIACGTIMLTFGEMNRYRERTHRFVDQPDRASMEAQLRHIQKHKEYTTAIKALNACMEQQRIVEKYYRENSLLREQARRCIEYASYRVEQGFLAQPTTQPSPIL